MQPQRQTNPWMIVLGVCGGCALLGIIVAIIATLSLKGIVKGSMDMVQNAPKFLTALKTHDYASAAALVDPASQATLNQEKIQSMETAVEKTLGSMKSFPQTFNNQQTSASPGGTGKAQSSDIIYSYTVTYEKGTATATFTYHISNPLQMSGLISNFKLVPDSGG